jgi:hypothetical protein
VGWLIVGMNYYYATLHFIVTISVLIWLYRRHPGRYGAARLVLFATTGVALVGYYLYPLAPPRLMTGSHFIDTVTVHHTWGSMASGNLKSVSNQYAAMPSMHIGWSLWCGLTIFALAKAPWARILGLLYPTVTLLVIVSTANHYWLDAVGGMICLAFGFTVSYLWYRKLPYHLPRQAANAPKGGRRGPTSPALPPLRPQEAEHVADDPGITATPRPPSTTPAPRPQRAQETTGPVPRSTRRSFGPTARSAQEPSIGPRPAAEPPGAHSTP